MGIKNSHPTENKRFSVPFKTRSFKGYRIGNSESQEDLKIKDFPSHLKQEVLKIQKSRKFLFHSNQEDLKVTKQEVFEVISVFDYKNRN